MAHNCHFLIHMLLSFAGVLLNASKSLSSSHSYCWCYTVFLYWYSYMYNVYSLYRYNRMLNKFVLSTLVLDHQNHAVSEEIFKLYPDNRRPHGATAQEVDNMLQVHGNPTLVAEVLHKQGFPVRVKDLYNRKRVVNNCKTSLSVRLENLLTQSHVHFKILTNSRASTAQPCKPPPSSHCVLSPVVIRGN